METRWRSSLVLGFILTGNASPADQLPVLTTHVWNLAEIDSTTLIRAEETATWIFRKSGIETRWIGPTDERSFPLSHMQVNVLPSSSSLRSGLPDNFPSKAMGLAPGVGPDRQSVYVFYDRVEVFATKHIAETHADAAQILGHTIAHEIGHLLLNVQAHSASGIMRSDWNLLDLRDASYGYLVFTTRQARAIPEEARRRRNASLP